MAVEDRVGIDVDTRAPSSASRGRPSSPARFAARKRSWKSPSSASVLRASRRSSIRDPVSADRVRDQAGQRGVCLGDPAPGRHAVRLVVEAVREDLREVPEHARAQEARVNPGDAVRAVGPTTARLAMRTVRGPSSPMRLIRLTRSSSPGYLARRTIRESPVDLVDDLQLARGMNVSNSRTGQRSRASGEECVIRVRQRPHRDLPRLVPRQTRLVEEDAHQLRHGERGVRVVHLARRRGRQVVPVESPSLAGPAPRCPGASTTRGSTAAGSAGPVPARSSRRG